MDKFYSENLQTVRINTLYLEFAEATKIGDLQERTSIVTKQQYYTVDIYADGNEEPIQLPATHEAGQLLLESKRTNQPVKITLQFKNVKFLKRNKFTNSLWIVRVKLGKE